MQGLDEVRVWKSGSWAPINNTFFIGEVLAVTSNSANEGEYVVGGNFTKMIIGRVEKNYSFLVSFDSQVCF